MQVNAPKRLAKIVALAGAFAGLSVGSFPQSINVDLDIGIGDPELGNGAPSSDFGGAAGQAGLWNRVQIGATPVALLDTEGQATSVVMSVTSVGTFSGGGFRNKANTGDYALLLNDAMQVGVLSSGGSKTFHFAGLASGWYEVYTYAVDIAGNIVETPVFVAQAVSNHTQIVTGPMPGNAFGHLITHSIHEVSVGPNGFSIYVEQPPAGVNAMHVNGFQIAPVPEPSTFCTLSLCCLLFLVKKRASLSLTASDVP